MNSDDFTVLVSGGSRCRWVSMYTVWSSYSQWLIEYSNESASNFALSLNIPLWKLFRWFTRPQLWATGDWQLHHNNASYSYRVFWQNIKSPRRFSPPTAQIWCPVTLAFLKTKITFQREEVSDHWWDSEKYNRAADGDWENCVRSQGAYFEGDWGIIVLIVLIVICIMFLVSSSINVSIFHIIWMDTF